MKSIEVIVPRVLVKKHYPHPEFYGESIVELLNGMVTDVYTNEKGHLFTITSENNLIDYLRSNQLEEQEVLISKNDVLVRSIRWTDVNLLNQWFNRFTNYSYNEQGLDIESIEVFVSHSITKFSHLFMIVVEENEVGTFGFSVSDNKSIITLEVYEKRLIDDNQIDVLITLMIDYIQLHYNVAIYQSIIFCDDVYTKKILERNQFHLLNEEYEFQVSFEDVKQGCLYNKDVEQ
ncbi:hypothetical protein [Candidatus Xianfuyuplasma coldseepsis]|uniref:N-acetyltransferase domain-containing protein n=1 Tax=Candidatus Xianfuyuplasma coldseepsis TaxID=2782163 RepID=A0A7L7KNL8_9MOLU|nr:hypothetical protein [Xianfuyuplasma coldseepsis]QMS84263.1 hypothetical protein G4Z02_00410 [Xianfuyuplasma coldseepsis]